MKDKWTAWQEKRSKKAKVRFKKQRAFKKKYPTFTSLWSKNFKPLILITSLVALTFIGLLVYSMYDQYVQTMYWSDHHEENVSLSEQPPSLLYDENLTSRNAKMNFVSIYQTIYDEEAKDFTDKVEQQAIEQLHMDVSQMTEDQHKEEYEEIFQHIGDKWHIERMHRDLYKDDAMTILKEQVTPQRIVDVTKDTFDIIHSYAKDSRNTDEFAKRIYEWQNKLIDDAVKLDVHIVQLNQWLIEDDGEWKVQPDLYPEQFETYVEASGNLELNYEWHSVAKLISILENVRPITKLYAQRHDMFLKIEEDLELKRLAQEEVEGKLLTAQANLNSVMANIDIEKSQLEARIQTLQTQQANIENERIALEERIVLAEENEARREQQAEEAAIAAEEARLREEERRRELEESESEVIIPEQPVEEDVEDPPVVDERYEALIGEPAWETMMDLTDPFTYERAPGVEPNQEGAVIGRYVIKEDGQVHFYVE